MIVIVDYDTGNTRSLSKAFEKIGMATLISEKPEDILKADGLVLPGVGAYPKAMAALKERGLIVPILEAVAKGTPLLGICLGMQLLFDYSMEYGETAGLGLIPGKVVPFPRDSRLRIPHMGWNSLEPTADSLVNGRAGDFVYYVHSYYVACSAEYVLSFSDYGVKVPGVVKNGNVYGTQFHPEKSGEVGLALLNGFKKVVEA
ncbi:imidazole glycerol phosphate synthase subunit HisH [uncultured Vagococcus sp.]|uniref:imidazole glycerol phosphate synthase subunit HisH n=1 Tax=uncultured Vagococcus sp. TaxID=189676 RepID=UPI0028D55650|nr:imidazole glycerol phosphate synthase subunit HisH [uncultured Vagococcus sp.]